MQLLELNIPMVIALNMMDEVAESGGSIDINGLEAELGVPVIPISAAKIRVLKNLLNMLLMLQNSTNYLKEWIFVKKQFTDVFTQLFT